MMLSMVNFLKWTLRLKLLAYCCFVEAANLQNFSQKCMGTEFKILIDHDDPKISYSAARSAFNECERLNLIFSDYLVDSEISRLSESSYSNISQRLSNELFHVLFFGNNLSLKTNGAFDPTIGHLSRLWRVSRFRQALPLKKDIALAKSLSGFTFLEFFEDRQEVKVNKPGLILDLGGIAKGFTADMMLKKLKSVGMHRSLIDAGGDITLGEPPRGQKGWNIEIGGRKHPDLPELELSNCSIATSGDIEQFVKIGKTQYSHILNPKTGFGIENISQVTMIAKDGITADSYATAASVLGPEKTSDLLIRNTHHKAFFLCKELSGVELLVLQDQEFNLEK